MACSDWRAALIAVVVDRLHLGVVLGERLQAPKLHAGEIDISTDLAIKLIAGQFPQWARLRVRPVISVGTECVLYRLGDDLVIRLPRRPGGTLDELLIEGVLPRLAPYLPVPVPELIAEGRPTADYPASWGVLRWIDGDTPAEGHLTAPGLLADDLAEFLVALWRIDLAQVDLANSPAAYRGGPLVEEHEFTLDAIEQVRGQIDADAARDIWDGAMQLPAWEGPATFVHADMMPGNVVTREGRLGAVIDFAAAGIGDPSVDLIVAWMLLPDQVRPAFRRATRVDDATWLRGRARALSWSVGHLSYYRDTNPVMAGNARYTIREVLADYHESGSRDPH
jgi:aminoglycoside phosphotransferase (APT) family kinase protein